MRKSRSIGRMSARMIRMMTKGIKAGELSLGGNRRGDLLSRGKSFGLPVLRITRPLRAARGKWASPIIGVMRLLDPACGGAAGVWDARKMERGLRSRPDHRSHFHSIISARIMIDGGVRTDIFRMLAWHA
jgi:hypothetical protein